MVGVRRRDPGPVSVVEVTHPAVAERLARLRDRDLPRAEFREGLDALGRDLAREVVAAGPVPTVLVPVLRAGLGFLAGVLEVLPDAECGFVGLRRDEATLEASGYAEQLPASLPGSHVLVLEPMVATGGTLARVVEGLLDRGAASVAVIAAVATPQAIDRLAAAGRPLTLVVVSVDEGLDEHGRIVPGIGDAGDRLFGRR